MSYINSFRCCKCHQIQFKYRIRGNKLEIETKCYNCNSYSYFSVRLDKLKENNENFHVLKNVNINKDAKK